MDKITIVLIDKTLYHTNMNTTYKSNNNVVYSCKYHVVWRPKYRRKVLTNSVDVWLKELLTEYALQNRSVDILEMEDHARPCSYALLEVDPPFGIHKAINRSKEAIVQNLRREFPSVSTKMSDALDKQLFCLSTVGGSPDGNDKTVYRKPENIAETKRIRWL